MLAPLAAVLLAVAPHPRVAEGVKHFDAAEYLKARDLLAPVVDLPVLPDPDRQRARMYLAASYHALGDLGSARAQLMQLARTYPDTRMDPGLFVPELIILADDARAEVAKEPKLPPLGACPTLSCPPCVQRKCPPLPEPPSLAYAFVPFGVGQFVNRQPVKGLLFLGTEVAALGTAALTFGMFEGLKEDGTFGTSGRFRDPERAAQLQLVYLATFYTGAALLVGGVVDAVFSRPDPPADAVSWVAGPGALYVRF